MMEKPSKAGVVLARVLLAVVFLLNAFGIIDQSRPLQEMIARGMPASIAHFAIWSGRAVELIAGLALAFGFQQRLAALALAGFMVPATLVAHPFWLYFGMSDLQPQMINACKNLAIIGGLLFVASTASRRVNKDEEGVVAARV